MALKHSELRLAQVWDQSCLYRWQKVEGVAVGTAGLQHEIVLMHGKRLAGIAAQGVDDAWQRSEGRRHDVRETDHHSCGGWLRRLESACDVDAG